MKNDMALVNKYKLMIFLFIIPGPNLLKSDLDTGPDQTYSSMKNLQESSGLEDVESGAGAGVETGHAASTSEVSDHLVEEVGPAQGLHCIVEDQIQLGDHVHTARARV